MRILALDTCLAACSVAVIEGDVTLAALTEPMTRGHQERLGLMVRETMLAAGLSFARLDLIAVTVGPGSFTGLRVGIAFAKGLSAALGTPCVGIGTLQALGAGRSGLTVAAVDARREQVYVQAFHDANPLSEPLALGAADAISLIAGLGAPDAIVGSGAPLLAATFPGARIEPAAVPDPAAVARLAACAEISPPRPLYLRAPDATLPAA